MNETTATTTETHKAAKLLAENLTQLMNTETYKQALNFKKKLHQYSFRNCLLIYLQCPTATTVAGYRMWQSFKRQVKKGETGIAIFAPILKRELDPETGEEQKRLVGFKSSYVFDISQTTGEDLPTLPGPELLTDTNDSIQSLIDKLESLIKNKGLKLERKDTGNALGLYSPTSKTILLRTDLPQLQQAKTLIHELAHALMHQAVDNKSRAICELEAESTAYLVCHSLNLDTSQYTFPYLLNWAEDPQDILPAAERACKTADEILETLRGLFFLQSRLLCTITSPHPPMCYPLSHHDHHHRTHPPG